MGTQIDGFLENSKAIKGQTQKEFVLALSGKVFRPHVRLTNIVKNVQFAHPAKYECWREACAEGLRALIPSSYSQLVESGVVRGKPAVIDGHLASGPTVGAAKSYAKWLKGRDRKYLGLEMEAVGVMTAMFESAGHERALVLRGVSDYSDERKKSLDAIDKGALRRAAVDNAVRFLSLCFGIGAFERA